MMISSLLKSISGHSFHAMHGGDEDDMNIANSNSTLSTSYHNSILLAHGALFTILFLAVLPASVLAAIGKRTKLHMGLQVANFLLFFIAIILAYSHESSGSDEIIVENRSIKPHVYFGTFIVICFFLQYTLGVFKFLLRRLPALRSLWRFTTPLTSMHKWLGYSVWLMGVVQLMIGYATYYGSCANGHDINCIGHWLPGGAISFFGFFILAVYIFHIPLSKPLEYYGSWVFITVGVPMMIFEHTWGEEWTGGDIFHVFLGGVINIIGGLLGIAAEMPYVKQRILSYNRIPVSNGEQAEKEKKENRSSDNLNFIPAIMVFVNGLALLFHDQNPPFNATMHACMGVTLLLLAPILFMMTLNESPVLRLLASFLLVLEGVFFFGVTYDIQLAAEQLFMGMFIEYAVILISLALILFAYVGAMMIGIQYCRSSRDTREYDALQKEDAAVPESVITTGNILPMQMHRTTSGDEARWMSDERSMNDGDMAVEVHVTKRNDQLASELEMGMKVVPMDD